LIVRRASHLGAQEDQENLAAATMAKPIAAIEKPSAA
jgi:hypothetical protein